MSESQQTSPNTPSGGGGQSSLRSLLRSRRNGVRGSPQSCLPCRERKVRCDKKQPCSVCDKRGHPDLCNYERRSASPAPSSSSTRRTTGRPSRMAQPAIPQEGLDSTILGTNNLQHADPHPRSHLSPSNTHDSTEATFLAARCLSSMSMGHRQSPPSRHDPARQSAFETGILPLLGANGNQDTPAASFRSLPDDQELVRLFEVYRDRVHPFQGITYNLDLIEKTMCMFMHLRTEIGVEYLPVGLRDYQSLGLLHAILASGAQFSDLPVQTCISLSQKHGRQFRDPSMLWRTFVNIAIQPRSLLTCSELPNTSRSLPPRHYRPYSCSATSYRTT